MGVPSPPGGVECYSSARPSPIGSTSGAGARTARIHREDNPEFGACRGYAGIIQERLMEQKIKTTI